jgi:hypothetical protein
LGRVGQALAILGLVLAALVAVPSASGATTVGQLFAPNTSCLADQTRLQVGVADGNSYAIPSAGVLTSWSFQAGTIPLSGLQFKVARPLGGNSFKIVGTTPGGPQTAGAVNTTPAALIPVQQGDTIGLYYGSGQCERGGGPAADTYAFINGDQPFGSLATYGGPSGGGRFPVQAVLDPGTTTGFRTDVRPRITCAGICHVILVKVVFDSTGNVIAEQALPGELSADGAAKATPLIKGLTQAVHAGSNKLKVKLTGAAQARLKRKGKLRINVRFTFTPTGGVARSQVQAFTVKVAKQKH